MTMMMFAVARSAMRMQETRFQIYLAQQHIEDINLNRFVAHSAAAAAAVQSVNQSVIF